MTEEQNIPEDQSMDDKPQLTGNQSGNGESSNANEEPQTKNYQTTTENMEVHKHPHHVTRRKEKF